MNLHNPAQIDPSLVGPNHKLLTVEELDKPLPEGAEWWDTYENKWHKCKSGDVASYHHITYRIPLKPSDRLRQERDRLDEQIRVVEAVEKGAEWGVRWKNAKEIQDPQQSLDWYLENNKWEVFLKPTPQTIPWTFETRPREVVWVYRKGYLSDRMITAWKDDGVEIGEYEKCSYAVLHSDWLQRNGAPAGEKVTA